MKVALITNYWKSSHGGGITRFLSCLVDELRNLGVDTRVVYRESETSAQHRIPLPKMLFVMVGFLRLLRIRPDVIHSNGAWYCLATGYVYKTMFRTRLVHTFHGISEHEISRAGKALLRMLIDGCDTVTFVSKDLEIAIRNEFEVEAADSRVVYGGASIPMVAPSEISEFRKRFGLEEKKVVIVHSFTASKLKAEGARLVVDALSVLRSKNLDVVLMFTRGGVYVDDLSSYADDRGVMDRVIFTGTLSKPEISVAASDVFVFPWLGGGGPGLALLEGMAQGKAVIVTNPSRRHEVVVNEYNGLIVLPNPQDIAEAIGTLIADPILSATLGDNARKTIQNHFTWRGTANIFYQTYLGD